MKQRWSIYIETKNKEKQGFFLVCLTRNEVIVHKGCEVHAFNIWTYCVVSTGKQVLLQTVMTQM